ncbi:hypothetical protein L950_0221895 [Sphingobacterium sp. IITKGP-BTPF85]|nr:hypothetical protein L950_0221895 [Sphingobacterium sp. IITKGP-BTPF85]
MKLQYDIKSLKKKRSLYGNIFFHHNISLRVITQLKNMLIKLDKIIFFVKINRSQILFPNT